jgi:peptide deformylase
MTTRGLGVKVRLGLLPLDTPLVIGQRSAYYHLDMMGKIDNLRIVLYPDPVLRARAKPIERVDQQVVDVAYRMLDLMHEAPGVGLAAPQVGLDWRMFVANWYGGDPDADQVFINPVLKFHAHEMQEAEEGCLSLPGVNVVMNRHVEVTIEAVDLQGQPFALTGEGLAARVWQHEYDHLDGVLIIDRMSEIDRMANKAVISDLEAACRG